MIHEHKLKCTANDGCNNEMVDIKQIYLNLKNNQFQECHYLNTKAKESKRLKQYSIIITLVQNEILNMISSLYLNQKLLSKIEIMLLHCNYLFYVKKNIMLSLYLIQEYMTKIKDIPFKYVVYFMCLKREIVFKKLFLFTLFSNNMYNQEIFT